jgi:hypothetical protein
VYKWPEDEKYRRKQSPDDLTGRLRNINLSEYFCLFVIYSNFFLYVISSFIYGYDERGQNIAKLKCRKLFRKARHVDQHKEHYKFKGSKIE